MLGYGLPLFDLVLLSTLTATIHDPNEIGADLCSTLTWASVRGFPLAVLTLPFGTIRVRHHLTPVMPPSGVTTDAAPRNHATNPSHSPVSTGLGTWT